MKISEEDYLAHYGTPRHSGRYPWGSGEDPYQRSINFLEEGKRLKKEEGFTDTEVARAFGMTTTEYRAQKSIARNEKRAADIAMAQRLRDKGYSKIAAAERMGIPESTYRGLLKPGEKDKIDVLTATSNMLRDQVNEKGYIDVGSGVELSPRLGVSRTRLNTALAVLQDEGYNIQYVNIKQVGTGKMTKRKVLALPGDRKEQWQELIKNPDKIQLIDKHSEDGGRSYLGLEPVKSIDSKRVKVVYSEDGGDKADGVIYVRPGVEDISLGKSRYAQVRIAVDDTHFLKGMAMYKSDLPDGVDLAFNTKKSKSEVATDLDAMKPLKDDSDNPFGATITRQSGVMNILNEEGDWQEWSKTLSSQMLSKQTPQLAKTQLDLSVERKQTEFNEIMSLTNPTVRRKLLETFAEGADSAAIQLKAAALPRQQNQVLLPVNTMKPTEVYAPNFENGTRVVLVRFPHGGIFEIPELVVNNKHRDARKLIGEQAKDAIGINSKVGERLSGADFDGDTVLVIPNDRGAIKTAPALEELKNFDPQRSYPGYEGMKVMSPQYKQHQMGDVSNLITDMTLKGATQTELARAVRHSMVVIDAEKHKLNYKQSAKDNGIANLKEKYQGGARRGASTLISRKKRKISVPERKDNFKVDPKTGKKIWIETGASYIDKSGKLVVKESKVNELAEVDDANQLSSGTRIEKLYAGYSNQMKSIANTARREAVNTKGTPYSPSAKAAYSDEVASLNAKLAIALRNAPLERQAQTVANAVFKMKQKANPGMEPDEIKKVKFQALAEARTRIGAGKQHIEITDKEWAGIQAGAISPSKLNSILNNSDLDTVKKLATPRTNTVMSAAMVARAKQMAGQGYTQAEIAGQLGVSASTVSDVIT